MRKIQYGDYLYYIRSSLVLIDHAFTLGLPPADFGEKIEKDYLFLLARLQSLSTSLVENEKLKDRKEYVYDLLKVCKQFLDHLARSRELSTPLPMHINKHFDSARLVFHLKQILEILFPFLEEDEMTTLEDREITSSMEMNSLLLGLDSLSQDGSSEGL